MRELIASGKARPEEIAIAAASPADFDDHMMALSADANIPIHFVHGVKAVDEPRRTDRRRARRNADQRHLAGTGATSVRAPARCVESASPVFPGTGRASCRRTRRSRPWSDGSRRSRRLTPAIGPMASTDRISCLSVLRLLEKGPEAAVQAGEELLPPRSLGLWRRALADGPPEALPVTLTQLRVADGLEPASHVIWTSAISLASSPRPLCSPARA